MTSESISRVVRGRYRLVSQLAVGGMGVTYRAWDLRAGGPVVLKMPRRPKDDPDGTEFARLAARFAREVEVMRALGHDHIVPIVDHGDDDGKPFVAMRFLPGGALSDHRKKTPSADWQPIPVSQLHTWLPSIAEALDFIHSKGVVHRDVKPANVFFDGFTNAFLGDFGIAKIVGDEAGLEKGQTLTATHLAIGTPEYMAPELLSPKAVADGRADQYALAISVYELIAGYRPFTGTTAHIVIEHASHPVPPLDRKALGLPSTLTASLERALAKKPADRFGSCSEFTRALLTDVQMQPYESGVVRLLCPSCRKVLRVPQSAGGRSGNCPACKQFMEIAGDFSALWLKSEASLVAEPPITPSAVSLLGTLDAEPASAETSAAPAMPDFAPGGSPRNSVAAAARLLICTLFAVCLGGLSTHWWWRLHHNQFVLRNAAALEQERAVHAEALRKEAQHRLESVQALELVWKKRFSELEQAREGDHTATDTQVSEIKREPTNAGPDEKMAQNRLPSIEAGDSSPDGSIDGLDLPETPTLFTNSVGITLRLIPAGTFRMEESGLDRPVSLTKPFYLGVHEVTNAQWNRVMRDVPSKWQDDERPVEQVSWEDVQLFCKTLSMLPDARTRGQSYRLPTEAEWEYSCRAGTTTAYSFGDEESRLSDYGWFDQNSNGQTHPVGSKQPNAWGLHDMHGNVWEWCSDWYGEYHASETTDPRGLLNGVSRVTRGGGWFAPAENCQSSRRFWAKPTQRNDSIGLRVALSAVFETPAEDSGPTEQSAYEENTPDQDVESTPVDIQEIRVSFDSAQTRIDTKGKSFWLISIHPTQRNEIALFDFQGNKEGAQRALAVIRHYGINERITLSNELSGDKFEYWLVDGKAPEGPFPSNNYMQVSCFQASGVLVDATRFRQPRKYGVIFVDGRRRSELFGPYTSKQFADRVLYTTQEYGFTCKCYFGVPQFIYLRK